MIAPRSLLEELRTHDVTPPAVIGHIYANHTPLQDVTAVVPRPVDEQTRQDLAKQQVAEVVTVVRSKEDDLAATFDDDGKARAVEFESGLLSFVCSWRAWQGQGRLGEDEGLEDPRGAEEPDQTHQAHEHAGEQQARLSGVLGRKARASPFLEGHG